MAASVQQVICLFIALTVQECQGACPTGWFGRGCTSKCRCRNSTTCDDWEGTCPGDGKCQVGYFGPGCQQLDICFRTLGQEADFLKDCDVTTCNPDVNAASVSVRYKYNEQVSFFRIFVNDPKYLRNFTVSRNYDEGCRGRRFYPVSDTAVDMVCMDSGYTSKITITGPTAGHLCSIHGALGRNVALKQKTLQSSNSSNHPEWGLSSNAIDDNTRNIYDENSSCSQTGVQYKPYWKIQYNHPVVLVNTVVYNRNIYQEKLSTMYLDLTYNTSYLVKSSFLPNVQPVRRVGDDYHFALTEVKIYIPMTSELTLCEVYTLGDFWCLDGIWGLNCDKQCTCGENQSCSIHTGACSEPCPVGKYGLRCVQTCSGKCLNGCTERWGLCKCQPEMTGSICLPDCPLGTYGRTCQFNCSEYCVGICHFPNGACQCKYGRTGYQCADCPVGRYGDDCSGLCPVNCGGNHCNISGFCYECKDGFFGKDCDQNCSSTCANSQCDMVTGKCFT